MIIGLTFSSLLMFGAMVINIFRKHMMFNLAVIFFATCVIVLYIEADYSGANWVTYGLLMIIGYYFWDMFRGKKK